MIIGTSLFYTNTITLLYYLTIYSYNFENVILDVSKKVINNQNLNKNYF